MKARSVLLVRDFAQSLAFWTGRLGFEAIYQSTSDGAFEFVVIHKDGVEIVLRRRDDNQEEHTDLEFVSFGAGSVVYLEVDSLAKALARLVGVEVVMPKRRTSYGTLEIAVREPGGHIICFSQLDKHSATAPP